MPPVPQAQILANAADEIRRLAVYLKEGGKPKLALLGLNHQLESLRSVRNKTAFTALNSYKNLTAVRLALSNAAAAIDGHIDKLEDLILRLEDAPNDPECLLRLAMMAPELKSIRFAPPLKDETVATVNAHSRIPSLDNLDNDD